MEQKKESVLGRYLKENVVVLLFELIIVVLLAYICSLMLGGEPVWLAPVLAVFAYLMAELRFMMAYVANASRQANGGEETATIDAGQAEETCPVEDVAQQDEEQTPYVPPVSKRTEEPEEATSCPDETVEQEPEDLGKDWFENPIEDTVDKNDDEMSWRSHLVEIESEMPDEQSVQDDLYAADIDLFDEPLTEEEQILADEISDIFTWSGSDDAPQSTSDISKERVSDPRDDEDPFSY
jgi:hypothetical protein